MMSVANKAVVLGNCQAPLIATYLAAGGAVHAIAPMPPVFEMTEDMRASVRAELDSADVIFAQRTADDYPLAWMRTSELRKDYGSRLVTWPNIYFDGYFPDAQYLYRPDWGKVQSPLEDYHFARVIQSFLAGRTVAEVAAEFTRYNEERDPFDASLQRLIGRETGLSVAISDFLAAVVSERRAFYTPNHPYSFVLIEMARRLAAAAALSFNQDDAGQVGYRLDRIYIPTHKGIQRAKNLRYDFVSLYRGIEVLSCGDHRVHLGRSRGFDVMQLIEAYYRVYEAVFERSSNGHVDAKPI